jgi:hypothetical protein
MFGNSIVKLAVLLGLLLLVIGAGVPNHNVSLAGDFIFVAAFIWGGFSSEENSIPLKITMIAIAGLFAIAAFASSFNLGTFLR